MLSEKIRKLHQVIKLMLINSPDQILTFLTHRGHKRIFPELCLAGVATSNTSYDIIKFEVKSNYRRIKYRLQVAASILCQPITSNLRN